MSGRHEVSYMVLYEFGREGVKTDYGRRPLSPPCFSLPVTFVGGEGIQSFKVCMKMQPFSFQNYCERGISFLGNIG